MKHCSPRNLARPQKFRILSASGLCLLLWWGQSAPLLANPTGGSVASGKATIGSAGSTETITQGSRDAIINWGTFSIDHGETTKFIVPNSSSMTLNRVTGGNISAIHGTLESNGKLLLINPNGILVGPSGRVDTAGFIGSTLAITDADFLKNPDLHFTGTGGGIVNEGTISASSDDLSPGADRDEQRHNQRRQGDGLSGVNGGLTLDAAAQSDAITATAAVNVADFNIASGS